MTKDHKQIWESCLKTIKNEVSHQSFKTWFEPIIPYQYKENTLTIQVPNQFFCEWLEEHYLTLLHKVIHTTLGSDGQLEYFIKKKQSPCQPPASPSKTFFLNKILDRQSLLNPLNPKYTFDNFIEGDCNQLTKSAGQAIAKNLGRTSFNPLMIYGKVGLGKTHVSQAITHAVKDNFPQKKVQYVSSEKFVTQFVEALRHNVIQEFINYYTGLDLLAVDDLQSLAGKEKTQDIFFSIFNHLHQSNKQIVMTSDRPPCDLSGLQKRLLSRFKWGLTTDLQFPDLETRIAITKAKLAQNNVCIQDDLIRYIAMSIKTNIRDIEGVVHSLVAHTSLSSKIIDLTLLKRIVQNLISEADVKLSPTYLQKITAEHYKLSVNDLKSKSRKREIVIARQVAMHLIKSYTNCSLKAIGELFGGKDHSTVMYAQKSVNNMLVKDPYFKSKFQEIKKIISYRLPSA